MELEVASSKPVPQLAVDPQLVDGDDDDNDDDGFTDEDNDGIESVFSIRLDYLRHELFDPQAELCLQHYNNSQQGVKFDFVELNEVRTSIWDKEYYFTFTARSNLDHSQIHHTFQGKIGFDKIVKECKISGQSQWEPVYEVEAGGFFVTFAGVQDSQYAEKLKSVKLACLAAHGIRKESLLK